MMEYTLMLFIVIVASIAIWVLMEFKRLRHKIVAVFLVFLLIFMFFSTTMVFKGKEVDYKTVSGLTHASKLYLAWLSTAFSNVKTITANAINMDWSSTNSTKE